MTDLPAPLPVTGTCALTAGQCKRMVAVWEAGADSSAPASALAGLLLVSDGKAIRAYATDGKILIEETITPDEFASAEFRVALTAPGMNSLRAMLKQAPKGRTDAECAFSLRAKDVLVSGWSMTTVIPLQEGTYTYPDIARAFDANAHGGACTTRYGTPTDEDPRPGLVAIDFAFNLRYMVALAKCWGPSFVRVHPARGLILTPLNGSGKRALVMPINLPA